LEEVWRSKTGEEKSYLQGVILVCAAYVHLQKGENSVAVGVLKRALKQLSYSEGDFHGIRTSDLKDAVEGALDTGKLEAFRI
jgi:uncharacterized protein